MENPLVHPDMYKDMRANCWKDRQHRGVFLHHTSNGPPRLMKNQSGSICSSSSQAWSKRAWYNIKRMFSLKNNPAAEPLESSCGYANTEMGQNIHPFLFNSTPPLDPYLLPYFSEYPFLGGPLSCVPVDPSWLLYEEYPCMDPALFSPLSAYSYTSSECFPDVSPSSEITPVCYMSNLNPDAKEWFPPGNKEDFLSCKTKNEDWVIVECRNGNVEEVPVSIHPEKSTVDGDPSPSTKVEMALDLHSGDPSVAMQPSICTVNVGTSSIVPESVAGKKCKLDSVAHTESRREACQVDGSPPSMEGHTDFCQLIKAVHQDVPDFVVKKPAVCKLDFAFKSAEVVYSFLPLRDGIRSERSQSESSDDSFDVSFCSPAGEAWEESSLTESVISLSPSSPCVCFEEDSSDDKACNSTEEEDFVENDYSDEDDDDDFIWCPLKVTSGDGRLLNLGCIAVSSSVEHPVKKGMEDMDGDARTEQANLRWNEEIDKDWSAPSPRRVSFCDSVSIHKMVVWSFAYSRARRGLWEEFARDRCRFLRRIQESEQELSWVLEPEHRKNIYESRFSSDS